MYLLKIYFNGPRTEWMMRPCDQETVFSQSLPWLWLARWRARGLMKELCNVGYEITDLSGAVIEPARSNKSPFRNVPPSRSKIHGLKD